MIDFMVLGLPRSGTAWLANLLTTDDSYCRHEAFWKNTLVQLDSIDAPGKFGVSETSGYCIPDVLNDHPARKLIVNRPVHEINKSLKLLKLPEMTNDHVDALNSIQGYRIDFKDLFVFNKMAKAYNFLLDKELSSCRHAMLCSMNIQNKPLIEEVQKLFI